MWYIFCYIIFSYSGGGWLVTPVTLYSPMKTVVILLLMSATDIQGGQKTDTEIYFRDNFGNSGILTILSLLQAEIYGA